MRRETQNVLLVLVGGAVVRISADHTYLRYVRSWTRPYLLTAGTVLLLLGLVSIWREVSTHGTDAAQAGGAGGAAPAGQAGGPAGDDGHGHGPGGPRVAWLLLLPVVAIFLVAPPALGSYAAGNRANNVVQPASQGSTGFAALPAGDPVTLRLTDLAVRAIWDKGRTLTGRHITLVGFVTPRRAGGYYLTRMVITCCAADAQPIRIAILGPAAGTPAADSWLAVTGSYGGMDTAEPGDYIPILRADSVTSVPTPAEPYES